MANNLKSGSRSHLGNICNEECKTLFRANIPPELRWVKLADLLRGVGSNATFTDSQKRNVQQLLIPVFKNGEFSSDVYDGVSSGLDEIRHCHCADKEEMLTASLDAIIDTLNSVHSGMEDLVGDEGSGMGDIQGITSDLVKTLQSGNPKDAIAQVMELDKKVKLSVEKAGDMKKELSDKATFDPLTKLYTRGSLDEHLTRRIEDWKANEHSRLSLIFFDIDHFKNFNDTYGHQVGDQVLAAVGAELKAQSLGTEMAARYGGEEMVIVVEEQSSEQTVARANDIRIGIEEYQFVNRSDGNMIKITASAGVGYCERDWAGMDAEEIMKKLIAVADAGVYKAKEEGRNRVCVGAVQ